MQKMPTGKYFNLDTGKISIDRILSHYRFDREEAVLLRKVRPQIEQRIEEILDGFYQFIFNFEHAKRFIDTEERLSTHRQLLRSWLLSLFNGRYDNAYFNYLNRISEIHVHIGLPTHYVNAAFSYLRESFNKVLIEEDLLELIHIVNRVIDINLDLLSLSYYEEEQKQFIDEVSLINRVIDTTGVEPYVQPIVNAQNGKVEKYECLMRFVDTRENKVYSAQPFLQIAKEIHLYHELEYMMIEKCFKKFSNSSYHFCLNIGYEDISDEQFRRNICQQISGFPEPERITFEILEGDFIEDFGIIKEFITKIRQYGCKIAIDDFGAGYSNMKNILELRPDYIKIDGSIIRSIHRSQDSLTILKSIIQLAHDLQIQTIAEHVHDPAVLEILKNLEIDYYQGFYFSKPFSIENLDEKRPLTYTTDTVNR